MANIRSLPFMASLLACSSNIDPNVRLEVKDPRPGSRQWPTVGFNDYCYKPGANPDATEARTRAMAEVFGQASRVLDEHKVPSSVCSMRTFYKDKQGAQHSRQYFVFAEAGGMTSNAESEVTTLTQQFIDMGGDVGTIPNVPNAVLVAFLRTKVAAMSTTKATEEPDPTPTV